MGITIIVEVLYFLREVDIFVFSWAVWLCVGLCVHKKEDLEILAR